MLAAPPQLISREDVNVGFNPIIESAALPAVSDIEAAVHFAMGY